MLTDSIVVNIAINRESERERIRERERNDIRCESNKKLLEESFHFLFKPLHIRSFISILRGNENKNRKQNRWKHRRTFIVTAYLKFSERPRILTNNIMALDRLISNTLSNLSKNQNTDNETNEYHNWQREREENVQFQKYNWSL